MALTGLSPFDPIADRRRGPSGLQSKASDLSRNDEDGPRETSSYGDQSRGGSSRDGPFTPFATLAPSLGQVFVDGPPCRVAVDVCSPGEALTPVVARSRRR